MKVHESTRGSRKVETYYDPHLRLWTAYEVCPLHGYQMTDAQYGTDKDEATEQAFRESRTREACTHNDHPTQAFDRVEVEVRGDEASIYGFRPASENPSVEVKVLVAIVKSNQWGEGYIYCGDNTRYPSLQAAIGHVLEWGVPKREPTEAAKALFAALERVEQNGVEREAIVERDENGFVRSIK